MMAQRATTSTYRTRHIAQTVGASVRVMQKLLKEKFAQHEGWHLFDATEYEQVVAELKPLVAQRRQLRNCWLSRK